MIEIHPFDVFIPPRAKYLILGSFVTKEAYHVKTNYEWYYSNGRNQFWPILEGIYGLNLKSKAEKERLFRKLHIALGDIIFQCERKRISNLDNTLINIVYNIKGVEKVLKKNKIEKIFFTSRFVENKFKRVFKDIIKKYPNMKFITLPSPSPRFAKMSLREKIKVYSKLLPKLYT